MPLNGKVALITGGVKNLGAATALKLAGAGANLALHYNSASSKSNASQLEAELKQKNPSLEVAYYQGNLTTAAAVENLFQSVLTDFGKIDIVVNTVGKVLKKPTTEISEEEHDSMFAINSKAAFFILKAAAAHIADDGKIITIVTALLGAFTGFYTSYAGSKAPVEHFTRGVCKELMERRVSVNNVAPGPMDTPFFYPQEAPEAVEFHKANAMANRLTMVQDIARSSGPVLVHGRCLVHWTNHLCPRRLHDSVIGKTPGMYVVERRNINEVNNKHNKQVTSPSSCPSPLT